MATSWHRLCLTKKGMAKVSFSRSYFSVLLAALVLLSVQAIPTKVLAVQVKTTVDSVHLEFPRVGQWDYQLKRTKNPDNTMSFDLLVPELKPEQVKDLAKLKSPRLKSVQVVPQAQDGKTLVQFITVSNEEEVFDYLTDEPIRLLVDVLPPPKSSATAVANKKLETKSSARKPLVEVAKKPANTKAPEQLQPSKREPASDALVISDKQQAPEVVASLGNRQGIFDGSDPQFDRFQIKDYEIKEEALIRSQKTVYVDFPVLKLDNPVLAQLIAKKPVYSVVPKDTEENKQVRLLITLYENKRWHVFNKTVEWFMEKFPRSEYEDLVRFMWADNLFALWLETRNPETFDLAMLRYRQALEAYPETPLMEWAMLLMGFATLDRGDVVGTLRQFSYHLETRPQSPNRDQAMLAIAEAFVKLNQFDRAIESYEKVEKSGSTDASRQLATFLKPDVYFQMRNFNKAIELYDQAIKKYPSSTSDFPNAVYNKAAAYFGMRDFKSSLNSYLEFLKKFPAHDYAGYAMTRVGEILEALGADENRVIGAYLETYFRYGLSPSALVARLRLLSMRMDKMKPKEIEKTIADLKALKDKSELPKIDQFTTLLIAEGYGNRKDYIKAIDELVSFYQKNPTTADSGLITNQIVQNVSSKLRDLVDQQKYLEGLQWHSKYSSTWLKNSDRLDNQYDLGRAYELAGAPAVASKLYEDTINRILSLKGTKELKERGVFEKLPSLDTLFLHLAGVENAQGKWADSYNHLKEIKQPETMSEAEQVQRVQLMSGLLEQKNELAAASRYLVELIKTWKGRPSLVAPPYLQLGLLELKQGQPTQAMQSFQEVHQLMVESGQVGEDVHSKALEKLGMTALELGKKNEALSYFDQLLSQYESSKPLASIRYKLGEIYFEKGELQKATEVWGKFKGPQGEIWNQLAQEQLRNSNWSEENKKYLKRIPAMAERNQQ